jgi:hypothetical protein
MLSGLRSRCTTPLAWAAAERLGQLDGDVDRSGRGQRAAGREALGEGLALEELHHEVGAGLVWPEIEQRDHARVTDAGDRARLGAEARHRLGVADQALVEKLDGDRPAEVDVLAAEDLAHAAGREERDDAIVADHGAGLDRRRAAGRSAAGGGGRVAAAGAERVGHRIAPTGA